MKSINESHNPALLSWVESANVEDCDFPLQNLPACRFSAAGRQAVGLGIGDFVFDASGYFETHQELGLSGITIESALSCGERAEFQRLLGTDTDSETREEIENRFLYPMNEVEYFLPFDIRDYTDFYCSIYHATNVGRIFRPDNPLLPNYRYVPIGYHGRASSIVITGTDVIRPKGQNRSDTENPPVFIPSRALDYEMEVGFYVGRGNDLGTTIPISEAEDHILGLSLVNDWSARDVQGWEAQPLGPFLGKNFATTVAPFVVSMDALAPFRVPAFDRGDEPAPLEYLSDPDNEKAGGIDLNLEVLIQTEKMREGGVDPHLLSRSNLKDLYWTVAQMLTHHASNGCNLQTGDLIASGTVSGKEDDQRACLLEITKRGKEPVELPNGEIRRFLEDGDEIIMRGFCEREGYRRIGFGECRGKILPSI
ncbi:MAG: fumarylacetoacetase [Pyrinomonadaceae bacterium]